MSRNKPERERQADNERPAGRARPARKERVGRELPAKGRAPAGEDRDSPDGVRLQVYLARSGLGSRRACEQYIQDGRVTVNGVGVVRMGVRVGPDDLVAVDGRRVKPTGNLVYLALHKPRGFITANSDPHGRPLVSDIFKSAVKERLFHVGRLDYLSTGLIFYTNDGEFARLVSHPGSRIEKEYLVEAAKKIEDEFLERYRKGMRVGDTLYRCEGFVRHSDRSVLITLREGKNRELRNVFTSRNIRLKRVHRMRIGIVTLKGLATGRFRRLSEREVRWFFDHARGD